MNGNHLHIAVRSWTLAAVLMIGLAPAGRAQTQPVPTATGGSAIFAVYCATCHGKSAKGDGPLASSMKTAPPDLTQIAKRNGGTFPATQVSRTIDGRAPVKGHGGGDMPVWGDALAKSRDQTPVDLRIQALVLYLESVQVKP